MFSDLKQEFSQGANDVQSTILPAGVSTGVHEDLVAELHHLGQNLGGHPKTAILALRERIYKGHQVLYHGTKPLNTLG